MNLFKPLIPLAVAFSGFLPVDAVAQLSLNDSSAKIQENFDCLWDNATSEACLTMPEGWKIDRNLTAPSTLNSFASASDQLMYSGGADLASNAKNGTWNFGSSTDESDRAVGGLSTTVSGGTRCVNLMTSLRNDAAKSVEKLKIGYSIEKYREGANAAGFAVQLYYSNDGVEWTSAGDMFYSYFSPDSQTLGASNVPISITEIEPKDLMIQPLETGREIYLAWNISVASGSSPDKAMGLAIDDISIEAVYESENGGYLYVENATGEPIMAYSDPVAVIAQEPGVSASAAATINGVNYQVWNQTSVTAYDLYFKVGASKVVGPLHLDAARSHYVSVNPLGCDVIADPQDYSGWVDPSRPAFRPSGIYLRGEVNSWAADSNWEFSDEGEGNYSLYDITLSGQFKIADSSWSSACNYGSNGSNVSATSTYILKAGTDDNISCGSYIFVCRSIRLNISESQATLTLEINDDSGNLTSVYVVGDFNGWDYSGAQGELKIDDSDNLFKGRLSMKAGEDGLSHWRLYQRPGLQGPWGAATQDDETATAGFLVKGSENNASVAPATYDVTFNIVDGSYNFTELPAEITQMTLSPKETVLVTSLPEKVKVLSLNNSLIYYNDQDKVFNDIAASMNLDASWTKHTLLGKSLATHWNEGDGLAEDGTPGAKMMVRSEAWSHIILQEQSSLPRTNPETFKASLEKWIAYIREYCPNPNAVIIIPVNWAYSSDWDNFSDFNKKFLDNYKEIADELGIVVCPVAAAYDSRFKNEGADAMASWFLDDRHPSINSTYVAACMEIATIFGIDPLQIQYAPETLTDDSAMLRRYASEAIKGYVNTVDHSKGVVRYGVRLFDDFGMEYDADSTTTFSVSGGGKIDSNGVFQSDGSEGEFEVEATNGSFKCVSKLKVASPVTEVITYPSVVLNQDCLTHTENFNSIGAEASAELPEAWRIDRQTTGPRQVGTYQMADTKTMYSGGVNLASNAKNGTWNFGDNSGNDRAIGGISTGVDNGTRCVNVYTHLFNDGRWEISSLELSYNVEKYRQGNNAAGFAVQLYYSVDGRNWTNAGDKFYTFFESDNATAGYDNVPAKSVAVKGTLPVGLGRGVDLFLAWNISVASGSAAQGAQAIAIDDFSIEGRLKQMAPTAHKIYVDNQTSWDAIGVYAYGDSELFGAWPGQAPGAETSIEGRTYLVFGLDSEGGNFNLIFNNWNNNIQLPDYPITANRDFYFKVDDNSAVEINPSGVESVNVDDVQLTFNGREVIADSDSLFMVYDLNGKVIEKDFGRSIDVSLLSNGLYIVKAESQNSTSVIKIAKR